MISALFKTVTGWFSGWMIYVILILVAANAFTYAMWANSSKQLLEFKIAGKLAEEEKERVEKQHNTTLKEVTNAWEKYSKDSKRKAIAAYDAKYRGLVCVQPGSVQVPMPGNAGNPETLHGHESERRACTVGFITACVNDAAFRRSVRSWVIKNQLRVDD